MRALMSPCDLASIRILDKIRIEYLNSNFLHSIYKFTFPIRVD